MRFNFMFLVMERVEKGGWWRRGEERGMGWGVARMNRNALDSNAARSLLNGNHTAENNVPIYMFFLMASQYF